MKPETALLVRCPTTSLMQSFCKKKDPRNASKVQHEKDTLATIKSTRISACGAIRTDSEVVLVTAATATLSSTTDTDSEHL